MIWPSKWRHLKGLSDITILAPLPVEEMITDLTPPAHYLQQNRLCQGATGSASLCHGGCLSYVIIYNIYHGTRRRDVTMDKSDWLAERFSENNRADESVTRVIRHHIKTGKEQEFEDWTHGITQEVSQFQGFQGTTILRPGGQSHPHPEYVTVVRFATYTDLRRCEESTQFAEWLQRLEPLLLEASTAQEVTGLETWFTIPGHTVVVPPPKYKMAVLATLGASPFVLVLIPVLISSLGRILPPVVISLIILLIMSVSMTWVTMPLLAWLARRWLYPVR